MKKQAKGPKFRVQDLPESFYRLSELTDDGCWPWFGVKNKRGYGRFRSQGKYVKAHIFAWNHFCGPVPDECELDHLCRNPSCVNPDHLEPVPHRVNVLRGESPTAKNARRTHCINGHPLSGENLYLFKGVHRHCKICRAARLRGYRKDGIMPSLRRVGDKTQ